MRAILPRQSYTQPCPAGNAFRACASGSMFVGCCDDSVQPCIDGCPGGVPCHDGCPSQHLRPASFPPEYYDQIPDQDCSTGSQWYKCSYTHPPFIGCCKTDPCDNGCSQDDLTASSISNAKNGSYFFPHEPGYSTNDISWTPAALTHTSTASSSSKNPPNTPSTTSDPSSTLTPSAAATTNASSTTGPHHSNDIIAGVMAGGGALLLILLLGLFIYLRGKERKAQTSRSAAPDLPQTAEHSHPHGEPTAETPTRAEEARPARPPLAPRPVVANPYNPPPAPGFPPYRPSALATPAQAGRKSTFTSTQRPRNFSMRNSFHAPNPSNPAQEPQTLDTPMSQQRVATLRHHSIGGVHQGPYQPDLPEALQEGQQITPDRVEDRVHSAALARMWGSWGQRVDLRALGERVRIWKDGIA